MKLLTLATALAFSVTSMPASANEHVTRYQAESLEEALVLLKQWVDARSVAADIASKLTEQPTIGTWEDALPQLMADQQFMAQHSMPEVMAYGSVARRLDLPFGELPSVLMSSFERICVTFTVFEVVGAEICIPPRE